MSIFLSGFTGKRIREQFNIVMLCQGEKYRQYAPAIV